MELGDEYHWARIQAEQQLYFNVFQDVDEKRTDAQRFLPHTINTECPSGMIPDLINGWFELFGGFFIILHCFRIIKDKSVKGVSIIAAMFFVSWGIWNLYYYPYLGQWISFVGGIVMVTASLFWVGLMFYYKQKEE
jgi:hypothetical protein